MSGNSDQLKQKISDYENRIKNFWKDFKSEGLRNPKRWKEYFKDHLPLEFEIAHLLEVRENEQYVSLQPRKALVLLVGFSFEPLFQAICAWKPCCKVVFILNAQYGNEKGRHVGKFLCEVLIPDLKQNLKQNPKRALKSTLQAEFEILPSAKPPDVFKLLREKTFGLVDHYGHDQVVLDITGGKKSMVAGAYLFGAYADIDISYVDFADEAWCPDENRPFGYGCQIGVIENPYKLFALREWQKVEELYSNYAFRSACQLIETLKTEMGEYIFEKDKVTGEEKNKPAIVRLQKMLEMYETWENGDFTGALKKIKDVESELIHKQKLKLPTAMMTLGKNDWPYVDPSESAQSACNKLLGVKGRNGQREGGLIDNLEFGNGGNPSLFLRSDLLTAYAIDELKKIRRLIYNKEDYRSALLRAASLNEVLLRARLMILFHHNELCFCPPFRTDLKTKKQLLRLTLFNVREILKYTNKSMKINKERTLSRHSTTITAKSDTSLWKADEMEEEHLADLRNKAIHFCLSITPGLAKAGLSIASQNFRDYYKRWVKFGAQRPNLRICQHYQTKIPWDDLCTICDVQFLPKKRNRHKKKKE